MKTLALMVRGHGNDYGVNGNFLCIQRDWKYLKYETYRMLNRRDQKGKLSYSKFLRIWHMERLRAQTTIDQGHMALATEDDLKSWMRKNSTSSSGRGSDFS